MPKDTSGPAFPCNETERFHPQFGMTLRDWFAGQALMGLIGSNDPGAGDRLDEIPNYAYDIADAMLVERSKAPNEGGDR